MTTPTFTESTSPPGAAPAPNRVPGLDYEKLLDCIHCGLCLTACPTYDILGTEADSPRGRIYNIRALADGRIDLNESFVRHLDNCLGCRACETACPSGTQYGSLLLPARELIEKQHPRPGKERFLRWMLLFLLSHPDILAPLLFPPAMLKKIAPGLNPMGVVGRALFGPKAPKMPLPEQPSAVVGPLPVRTPAVGEQRARVAFLPGCVMQVLYQRVNEATLRVLAANGCEVIVPSTLGCCGALHMHEGYVDDGRARARKLIETLERERFDVFVTNSAGCGSALKDYPELFHDDPKWRQRAEALASRVRDVSEFLMELPARPPKTPYRHRVAYHDACHLAHAQNVRTQPRDLLKLVPGLELLEIERSDHCCGSAGIYNFMEPEMAAKLQAEKVANVVGVKPEVLVTGNPGCHAWIEAGLQSCGAGIVVKHTMEVLDAAYASDN